MQVGDMGFWWRSIGGPPPLRAPLEGPAQADVAIVGAGYTGLWTAYYLKRARPELEIVVLEREFAGFGASGRNGGWVSGFFAGSPRVYERDGGRDGLRALREAMFATVDEVGTVVDAERIEADFVKGGQLSVALGPAQALRLREHLAQMRAQGVDDADLRELNAAELAARLRVTGANAASFTPHVARMHPAKLVRGLAQAVEALGVRICEQTRVSEIRPHAAITRGGTVSARWVVRATEGYTRSLRGLARALLPLNSSMVITEPLPDVAWAEIGWQGCELVEDAANVYVYLQRTADGRIAIGGRGVPYRYGSDTGGRGWTPDATVESLRAKLAQMFPAAAGVALEHAWSGVFGVPRDWSVTVHADARSGLVWAGGYVGLGVAASNLAARIVRDLIVGEPSALTQLPWVRTEPRRWEPEPFRFAGVRGVYSLYRRADREESRSGRPSPLARVADLVSGRH